MKPIYRDYTFCPSCGQRIYNYEEDCGICGAPKTDFENLEKVEVIGCPVCGRTVPAQSTYCSSCGNLLPGRKRSDDVNYEATNVLQKTLQDCKGGIFAIFLAVSAICCSVFGIFYGILCILCSLVGIGVQIHDIKKGKSRYGYAFIAVTAVLILIAVFAMVICAVARAEIAEAVADLFF